jgi:hypothetical protein
VATKKKAKSSKGLSVKTFKGLNKKRIKSKGGAGKRVVMKQGDTVTLQFMQDPTEFIEIERHEFQEEGQWQFVPCAGDDCPLCVHEDDDFSKTRYRFFANVWNTKEKKVQVLDGPKDLASRIFAKFERKPQLFKKRVYDISKLPTQPVSYDVEIAEEDPVKLAGKELLDLEDYLQDELKRYYGDDLEAVKAGSTSLDDDDDDDLEDDFDDDDDDLDDEEDEEDGPDEDDMQEMTPKELKAYAKEVGVPSAKIKAAKKRSDIIKAIVKKRGY